MQRHDAGIRILFVADAQIIGYQNEKRTFANVIRWDADRFLYKGFSKAVVFSDPHIIVFLGDEFDEGEIATDNEFSQYMDKFHKIFTSNIKPETMILTVPGDNDVGGEYPHKKSTTLSRRFQTSYNYTYPALVPWGSLNFVLGDAFDDPSFEKLKSMLSQKSDKFQGKKYNFIINHMEYSFENLRTLIPISVIFTAHNHLSRLSICRNCQYSKTEPAQMEPLTTSSTIHLDLGQSSASADDVIQLELPTCSYRMGVPNPAYGFVNLQNGSSTLHLDYTLLWLPHRFSCLHLYILFLVAVALRVAIGVLLNLLRFFLPSILLLNSH